MSQRCCKRAVDRVRVRVVTITGLVPEIPISMGTPADATGDRGTCGRPQPGIGLDEVVGAPNAIGPALFAFPRILRPPPTSQRSRSSTSKQLLKSQGGDTHVRRVSSDP